VLTATPGTDEPAGDTTVARAPWYCWAVPATVMASVGAIGLGSPSLWGDELATWGMATVPWDRGAALLQTVDAVMAPYYAAMNAWVHLAGDSDVVLRLPSLVAMVATAALVGLVGTRADGPRTGLVAGVLLALLPLSSAYAQEARVYAFADLAVVLAGYLLLGALERPTRRRLAGYGAAVALVGLCHLVALLILLPHAVLVLVRARHLLRPWAVAAAAGTVPALPLVWFGWRQRGQIRWLATFTVTPADYLSSIGGSVTGGLVVVGLCLLGAGAGRGRAGLWFAAWAVLPPLALLAASPVIPMMLQRYLLFVLPGWMLLAATGLVRLWDARRGTVVTVLARTAAAVAVVVVAALGVPWQWGLRGPAGHNQEDARALARTIGDGYRPGDAVVYAQNGDDPLCCSWMPRDALIHYTPADRRPADVLLRAPQRVQGRMNAAEYPDVAARLAAPRRVWVVRLGYRTDPLRGLGADRESLVRDRFRQAGVTYPAGFTVALLVAT